MKKKALVVHCTPSEKGPDLQTLIEDMLRTFICSEYCALIMARKESVDPQSTL